VVTVVRDQSFYTGSRAPAAREPTLQCANCPQSGTRREEPLQIEDGYATPTDAPGSGIAWNEETVTRYLAE
jgi:L-alanine-DL-glutamate epimerase-like enolase superfamily enzyme